MATSTPQTVNSGLLSAHQENAAVTFLAPNAMGLLSTMAAQPQGMSLPPPIPPAPQGPGDVSPYAGIPPEMLSKFFPTQFDKPTVLPTGTAYKPQNFGDFGFDKQMVDYLNNQRKMSATDAGIDYVYDPATQTFKGRTMGGPVTKTLDQMRQAAAGYKPGMGGGMGQPFSPQVQVPPDMEKRLAMERANMPYTPPSQIPISQEQIRAMLQGTPSGANGPYPAQVSTLPVNVPQRTFVQQTPVNRVPPQAAPIQPQINAQQQQALQQRAQQRQALQTAIQSAASAAPRQTSASRYTPRLPNVGMAAEDIYRYLTQNLIQPRVMNKDTIAKKG